LIFPANGKSKSNPIYGDYIFTSVFNSANGQPVDLSAERPLSWTSMTKPHAGCSASTETRRMPHGGRLSRPGVKLTNVICERLVFYLNQICILAAP
jgi:hypothetical protein